MNLWIIINFIFCNISFSEYQIWFNDSNALLWSTYATAFLLNSFTGSWYWQNQFQFSKFWLQLPCQHHIGLLTIQRSNKPTDPHQNMFHHVCRVTNVLKPQAPNCQEPWILWTLMESRHRCPSPAGSLGRNPGLYDWMSFKWLNLATTLATSLSLCVYESSNGSNFWCRHMVTEKHNITIIIIII